MKINHDRILFLGIGGGNDVFSCILAMLSLREIGWTWNSCAIAGVLSPFHKHTGMHTRYHQVLEISAISKRHVVRNDRTIKIGFVDSIVAELVQKEKNLGI